MLSEITFSIYLSENYSTYEEWKISYKINRSVKMSHTIEILNYNTDQEINNLHNEPPFKIC